MVKLIASVKWYGDCASFWTELRPDYTREEATKAVKAFVASKGRRVGWVAVFPGEAWHSWAAGPARLDVYFA